MSGEHGLRVGATSTLRRVVTLVLLVWLVSALPLQDAAGEEIGHVLAMLDISTEKAAFARFVTLAGTVGGVLMVFLLAMVYVLLRRTDAGIRVQQAELRESEANFRAFFETIDDLIVVASPEGKIWFANRALESKLDYRVEELAGMTVPA